MALSEEQIERYSRHIILQQVGGTGQEKLLASSVLIVGAGGLGSPAALYLAAAGIGTIGIIDADNVDLTNLQRQIIHHTPDVGTPKVESSANKMRELLGEISRRKILYSDPSVDITDEVLSALNEVHRAGPE